MRTSFALVHHANQYLITNGYDNREGIEAVVGSSSQDSGFAHILRLHERYAIAFNLHISGTLLEAIAWHVPEFLDQLRRILHSGLIELVGSSYGQNIMRFFGADYNIRQLNEELLLYKFHLGVDPVTVKSFWPPERVWDTRRMAPVLRDARLLNDGYRYVILDDRLLLDPKDPLNPRHRYDETGHWDAELFRMHEIENGMGLTAFPIGTRLRRSIPPQQDEDWKQVQSDLEALLVHSADQEEKDLLAMYADDLEKVAGIGEWGESGPARYEAFLQWLSKNKQWLSPVKLSEWAAQAAVSSRRRIERGTFQELAVDFDAGEGYERWYLASDWAPYRGYFAFAETKVNEARSQGGDRRLLELADKQLLVANWETAWHTPSSGPHGDAKENGHASPWARALTSHSRHAAVTAAAALWLHQKEGVARAFLRDIDADGELEVVVSNDCFFGVFSPRWGGRLVALYCATEDGGAMVIGNPCDDWNWMEELNKYMDVPRNHPGAFADVGYEHEPFTPDIIEEDGKRIRIRFTAESGLVKELELSANSPTMRMQYDLPSDVMVHETELGLSPDYLRLLRGGSACLEDFQEDSVRGCRTGNVAVWVRPQPGAAQWAVPYQPRFGHGCALRIAGAGPQFWIELGVHAGAASTPVRAVQSEPVLA